MSDLALRFGIVDVTPECPVPLAGNGNLALGVDIGDPLEINVLIVHCGDGSKLALISIDTLFVGEELRAVAEKALPDFSPAAILFSASHTHFAPATESALPNLGRINPQWLAKAKESLAQLLREVQAMQAVPVRMECRKTNAEHSVNRRRRKWLWPRRQPFPHLKLNYYALAPNPDGVKNENLWVVGFFPVESSSSGAKPLAVVWSYACHPVSQPRTRSVSADFPGVVRRQMRAEHGDGLPCLFLQGFSGNIRPHVLDRSDLLSSRMKRMLLGGLHFGSFDAESWQNWSASLSALAISVVNNMVEKPSDGTGEPLGISCRRLSVPQSEFCASGANDGPIYLQRIRIGSVLEIVAISAEPVQEFAGYLPTSGVDTITVGCVDAVRCYLPTTEILEQGGYEADEFRDSFSYQGRFRRDVGDRLQSWLFKLYESEGEALSQ